MRPRTGRIASLTGMAKYKPTRVVTPRIVQPGEGSRVWLWSLVVVALVAWTWQVFEFGRQRAGFDVGQRNDTEDGLLERIAELEQERATLIADTARLERSSQIDRAATDGVKSEVKALQEERAELKREVAFLKSLVSNTDNKLVLDSQALVEVGEGLYRFEVTLSKRTEDANTVSGQVTVSVTGEHEGVLRKLDMDTLTKGSRSNIGLRFKNFQKLKTELVLPKGFQPTTIEVAVKPDSKGFRPFEQSYDWKVSDA